MKYKDFYTEELNESKVVADIEVIYTGELLDSLYGKNEWFDIKYEDRHKKIIEWCKENNALYFPWGGPSYLKLAKENEAIRLAIKNKNNIVLIEPLS